MVVNASEAMQEGGTVTVRAENIDPSTEDSDDPHSLRMQRHQIDKSILFGM